MPIYDCKCKNCKAEFHAILEDENEKFNCPACEKDDIERKPSEFKPCSGGCGGCDKGCN